MGNNGHVVLAVMLALSSGAVACGRTHVGRLAYVRGEAGGACYPNGTCNAGLVCAGHACVSGARDSGSAEAGSGVTSRSPVDEIDLLFMIDNSLSMADKQGVLKAAVPELARRLASPGRSIHVGVITSSLGGHGSTLCQGADGAGLTKEENDDHAHLIASRPRFADAMQANPGGQAPDVAGFLGWSPDADAGQQLKAFDTTFQAMTTGAGELGCGLESQLEAIYRFLVDPSPSQTVVTASCPGSSLPCAYPVGRDEALLAQRKAFLRPGSLVSIIMVTDENDCSIRESQQYYYAGRPDLTMTPGSAVCATNPNDPCCYSCAASPPAGCQPDPTCATRGADPGWASGDQLNLRCYQEKKRFGLDFLYPTERYVNALSKPSLCTSRPDLNPDPSKCPDLDGDQQPDIVPNPLLHSGTATRDPSLVFLAGIVGVPWQDIQAVAGESGTPFPSSELHYKTAKQLADDQTWDVILGSEHPPGNAAPILPTDTLMVESVSPRTGLDGENPPRPLAAQDAGFLANAVNGHEWGNTARADLQYACIFRLAAPRDCKAVRAQPEPQQGCDCKAVVPGDDNPLCQDSTGAFTTNQGYAKAYPGLRELTVLRDLGANSIVASICARNLTQPDAQDYGYRPAVDSIVDRLEAALQAPRRPDVVR